jgi:hypothetical protein
MNYPSLCAPTPKRRVIHNRLNTAKNELAMNIHFRENKVLFFNFAG